MRESPARCGRLGRSARGIQTDLCVLLSEYYGTICSPSYTYQLYLTLLRLCLFCIYRNCSSTDRQISFPEIFPDQCEIPDFPRFSRWVATVQYWFQFWILFYWQLFVACGRMQVEEYGVLICHFRLRQQCQSDCCPVTQAQSLAVARHQSLTWLPLLELIVSHTEFVLLSVLWQRK